MKKLSILIFLLTLPVFAQSERVNVTDGGSICKDKNNDQYRSIDSLNGQVSDIAKAIDLNRRFTYMELENICHAMRTSALDIVEGKNYYEFEEIMMRLKLYIKT